MLWILLLDLEVIISFGWSDYMKLSLCENVGYILIFIGQIQKQTKHKNTQITKKKKVSREFKLLAYKLDL